MADFKAIAGAGGSLRYKSMSTGRFISQRAAYGLGAVGSGGGGLSVPLDLNSSGFTQGMGAAAGMLQQFQGQVNTTLSNLRSSFSALSSVISPLRIALGVGGLAGGFVALMRSNEMLNRSMQKSVAIMGDVSGAMKGEMRAAAIDVARTTIFSASEAADAYFYLASAGLNAKQVIGAMPKVAQFAQAGMFDLATATNLLVDSQSALGLRSKDTAENLKNMVRVSDVLTQANILANAEVQDFALALQNDAAAALRLVGKDVEEGVAVLAAFADQGTKGAEAGTALGIVMRDLQTKAIKFKDAWHHAGIAVFDTGGQMRNMADIIQDLDKAMVGMSDERQKQFLLGLGFSDRSLAYTQALMGTSDRIREYEKALRDAGGATEALANKNLTEMQKALNNVKGAWQEMSESMAKFVSGSATAAVAVSDVTEALWRMFVAGKSDPFNGMAIMDEVQKGLNKRYSKPQDSGDEIDTFMRSQHTLGETQQFLFDRAMKGDKRAIDLMVNDDELRPALESATMHGSVPAMSAIYKWQQQQMYNRQGGRPVPLEEQGVRGMFTSAVGATQGIWGGVQQGVRGFRNGLDSMQLYGFNKDKEKMAARQKMENAWDEHPINKIGQNLWGSLTSDIGGSLVSGLHSYAQKFGGNIFDQLWARTNIGWQMAGVQGRAAAIGNAHKASDANVKDMGTLSALDPSSREGNAQRVRSQRESYLNAVANKQLTVQQEMLIELRGIKTNTKSDKSPANI